MFSIIIPTKNSAKFIRRSLTEDSRQPDAEIIVVDGGSTDGTQAIVREFPEVRLIEQQDETLWDGWNRGVQEASHDLILFHGADDYLLTDAGAVAESLRPYQWLMGKVEVWRDGKYYKTYGDRIVTLEAMKEGNVAISTASFIHRDLYAKFGPLNGKDFFYAADYELFVRLLKAGIRPLQTDKVMSVMAYHGDNFGIREYDPGEIKRIQALCA